MEVVEAPGNILPENVLDVRYIAPVRTNRDTINFTTVTILDLDGFMVDPLKSQRGRLIRDTARQEEWGYISFNTQDLNGKGPLEVLKTTEFKHLVDAIVGVIRNPKFEISTRNKILLSGYSISGWLQLVTALELLELELGGLIAGLLLLAPAVNCLTPYYQKKTIKLKQQGKTAELEMLKAGEVVRLDSSFGRDQYFPLCDQFQQSSWEFVLDELKLEELFVPTTLVVGEEDMRVNTDAILDLYKKIPLGNKRLIMASWLDHSYDSADVYNRFVREEVLRLGRGAIPNLAAPGSDDPLLVAGLNRGEWVVQRKSGNKLVYRHIGSGYACTRLDAAIRMEQDLKRLDDAMGLVGDPTDIENRWGVGRTEVERINPQEHPYDLPQAPPAPQD